MPDELPVKVVFLPGLRGHVEDHWQTRLARLYPNSVTVPPLSENGLSRLARVENLARTLQSISIPVVIVAHSAGCMILAHWASGHVEGQVVAALLATPADLETPLPPGYPTISDLADGKWLPVPKSRLPFPTLLAASRNDPLCSYSNACELAKSWGSRVEDLGEVGHLNPVAGFGDWPAGKVLIDRMLSLEKDRTGIERSAD
ncbi:MAG: alpha/beta hydrolase [Hyphomonadaceae bacterium BRH_c29]|nr:MAG: alpha/beta hydrolase [Hyphomonadaceae bacterium BRH_c29]